MSQQSELLLNWINDAGGSITLPGAYDLSKKEAQSLADNSISLDVNLFEVHKRLTHFTWDQPVNIDSYTLIEIREFIKMAIKMPDAFSSIDIGACIDNLKEAESFFIESQKYQNLRQLASIFTCNSNVRKIVFNRDGRHCAHCQAKHDLCLDHILPVKLGGQNEIENWQVRCRSCNSKKGARV